MCYDTAKILRTAQKNRNMIDPKPDYVLSFSSLDSGVNLTRR